MKLTRRLLSAANIGFRIIALIASFAVLTSPLLARDDGLNGCTPAQEQSASGVACGKKMDEDMSKHYTNIHTLRCTSGRMECCIQLGTGGWGQCEPALAAPRNTKDIQSPSTSDVVCASLKSARGEWKADSRSIKANSDNKTCSQTYVCGAPDSSQLSADQRKCSAVVSVSNKQVTQSGTCVPGSKPGTCSSCLAKPPNEPCTVAFAK